MKRYHFVVCNNVKAKSTFYIYVPFKLDLKNSAPNDLMHFYSFYDNITFQIKMKTANRTILFCAFQFCLVYEHINIIINIEQLVSFLFGI